MRPLLILATLLAGAACCRAQCLTANDAVQDVAAAQEAYVAAAHRFSAQLFQKLYFGAETEERNLFFSPHSIWSALTLAYFGAEGNTQTAMEEAMGLSNLTKAEVMAAFRAVTDKDKPQDGEVKPQGGKFRSQGAGQAVQAAGQAVEAERSPNTLRVANRLYFDKTEDIRECMKELFHGELELLNFHFNSEQARNTINTWVQEQTADRIKDLIPAGAVDATTRIVLANAAYFKGTWYSQFKASDTSLELFYSFPNYTFVNMMTQKGQFNHTVSEELQAHVLELPYEGQDISMYLLLPPFVEGALDVTVRSLTPEKLINAIERMFPVDIRVKVPKFRVEETYEISQKLSEIGFQDLFDTSSANLRGFSRSGNLALSNALHKAFLEINEEGAEAAASTSLIINRSGRPKRPRQFVCNHPFLYVIFDKTTQSMLFMGTFENPNAASLSLGKKV